MTMMRTTKTNSSSDYIKASEVLTIRTSLVKMYLRCPAQCMFRYFKGLIVPPRSYATMGSCFHKSAEHHYKYKLEKGKNSKLSTLQDVFHEEFKLRQKETQWVKAEKPDKLETEGIKQILPVYYKERALVLEPTHVEEPFKLFIPEANAYLTGTLDLTLKGHRIRDHKLRQRSPNWMDAIKSLQGISYSMGYEEKFKHPAKCFNLDYIIRKKEGTVVQKSKDVIHDQTDFVYFKTLFCKVIKSIREGMFYPRYENNFLCSPNVCGYWGICRKGQWRNTGVFTQVFGHNQGVAPEDQEEET